MKRPLLACVMIASSGEASYRYLYFGQKQSKHGGTEEYATYHLTCDGSLSDAKQGFAEKSADSDQNDDLDKEQCFGGTRGFSLRCNGGV
ncbi:hypothetical protein EV561_1351 [Rhizobium sp. BK376]|nr:hypothetical protein EV561_1351 [Rhizobium sp. BK376]